MKLGKERGTEVRRSLKMAEGGVGVYRAALGAV